MQSVTPKCGWSPGSSPGLSPAESETIAIDSWRSIQRSSISSASPKILETPLHAWYRCPVTAQDFQYGANRYRPHPTDDTDLT